MRTTEKNEIARNACEQEIEKIKTLMAYITEEIGLRCERDPSWPMAGTLADTRKWLTDTLGILTGKDTRDVERIVFGIERTTTATMVNRKGRRVRVTIPAND